MKKSSYFVLFIVSILIYSCSVFNKTEQTDKTYYDFNNQKKSIKIIEYQSIPKFLNLYKDDARYSKKEYVYNDTTFLMITNEVNSNNNIVIFDLLKGTRKKINFDQTGFKQLLDFGFVNQDSIFLFYNEHEAYGFHDSLIYLANSSGEIIKSYTLKDAPVVSRAGEAYRNESKHAYMFPNWIMPVTFRDNKLFLHFHPFSQYLGDTLTSNLPIAGYINTTNNQFHTIPISYPDFEFGKHYYDYYNARFFSTFAHNGDLLYAFKYTPTIIKHNYKTGKSTQHQIKSTVFDTIYSALSPEEIPKGNDFSSKYPRYYKLQYDKYRNLYYRFVLLPKEYGDRNYMVIVADTAFNVIAEGFTYRRDNQYDFAFTEDYFFDGSECYNMTFREGTNTELIAKLKSMRLNKKHTAKPLTHYLEKNGKIQEKNYTAIIMWHNETCLSTKNFFFGLYQTNAEKYDSNDVYFFIVSDDAQQLRKELEKYNLKSEQFEKVVIDSTYEYGAYTNYETHAIPRIIKVRKNKIAADTIFSDEDGGIGIQKFIIKAGKEQEKLKKQ